MEKLNLLAGWIGIVVGFVTGAIMGLFFKRKDWLDGYASWPRRMVRLGHISFHGLAFINLAFAFTVSHLGLSNSITLPSLLFILGAVTMPLCCFICAFKATLTPIFIVPVFALVAGSAIVLYLGLAA